MPRKAKATATKNRPKSSKATSGPTLAEVEERAAAAGAWLRERRDYHGYLVRRGVGRGAPELASHLRGDIQAKQQRDGFWLDPEEEVPSLTLTAEALWQLLNLGLGRGMRAVDRAVDWIVTTRGQDGAFGEGTALDHTLTPVPGVGNAFFSPGPSDEAQELVLSNGQSVTSDAGARLLASERALRSILRANPEDPRAIPSIMALRGVPLYLEYGGTFTPAVLVGALQALGWMPRPYTAEIVAGLETLRATQETDGGWPNIEFFLVLETLLEVRHPLSTRLLESSLGRLMDSQHKNGSWGRNFMPQQTWIGLQVYQRVISGMSAM